MDDGGDLERPRHGERAQLRGDAAAEQAVAEASAAPRQPALDRADRPAQVPRGLLVGAALEVAEDDRRAVTFGEPVDLLVQQPLQLDVAARGGSPARRHRRAPLEATVAGGRRPGARRGPVGDLVQPGAERIPHPEPARPLHQDQERGLEGVLGVVRVSQHAPADPQDHRPVPLHQDREGQLGGLAPVGGEPLQELAVGQLADRADVEERPELPAGPPHPCRSLIAGTLRPTVPHAEPT